MSSIVDVSVPGFQHTMQFSHDWKRMGYMDETAILKQAKQSALNSVINVTAEWAPSTMGVFIRPHHIWSNYFFQNNHHVVFSQYFWEVVILFKIFDIRSLIRGNNAELYLRQYKLTKPSHTVNIISVNISSREIWKMLDHSSIWSEKWTIVLNAITISSFNTDKNGMHTTKYVQFMMPNFKWALYRTRHLPPHWNPRYVSKSLPMFSKSQTRYPSQ